MNRDNKKKKLLQTITLMPCSLFQQTEPFDIFNKGSLMNAGFSVIRERGPFDCYIFHDVDMLLMNDRNPYTCTKVPRHLGGYLSKWNYK